MDKVSMLLALFEAARELGRKIIDTLADDDEE